MLYLRLLTILLVASIATQAQEPFYTLNLFNNSRMTGNYFYSRTLEIKPSAIRNINGKLPLSETIFNTPGNALQLDYKNAEDGRWEAQIFRKPIRGQDYFKPVSFLQFSIYVETSKIMSVHLPSVKFFRDDSTFSKSYPITVSGRKGWEKVTIRMDELANITTEEVNKIRGVAFSQNNYDGSHHTIYIDDIDFTSDKSVDLVTATPEISSATGYAKHVDITWQSLTDKAIRFVKVYRSTDGKSFIPIGIQSAFTSRYTDFTNEEGKTYQYKISFLDDAYTETALSSSKSASTKHMTDEALLDMVQEAAFRYYWEGAETESGLAKENILGRHNMIASGASGFGIMALIVGTEKKFVSRDASVERFLKITSFLEKAETFRGAYAHFIDGPSGKVEPFFGKRDNGGDLVETSFLIQGLLAAKAYFNGTDDKEKIIRDRITGIWNKVEWDWYRQYPDSKFLYWHWSPDQHWVINHNLIGWNETMVTYLLAIASPTHSIPASMYYSGWANQDSTGQKYRMAWGGVKDGSMYSNGNSYYGIKLDVGVSNGGPLFFTHYSYLGYDPHLINDKYTNYFSNNKNIALINYKYALDNPNKFKGYGDSCWGLTASDGPFDYSADEPTEWRDLGKIAPTGAISSFPYTPEESMKALKNFYYNHGKYLWGEYGFRDAFNLTENWCSDIYMGLNQAPMTVMIENYRTGLIWKLFMSNEDIINGLKKLDVETNSKK